MKRDTIKKISVLKLFQCSIVVVGIRFGGCVIHAVVQEVLYLFILMDRCDAGDKQKYFSAQAF